MFTTESSYSAGNSSQGAKLSTIEATLSGRYGNVNTSGQRAVPGEHGRTKRRVAMASAFSGCAAGTFMRKW